jgi:hypothetical protein
MKNDVMPSVVQMDSDELKNLLTEVKETVATDPLVIGYAMPEKKIKPSFGIADLWNVRKTAKSASSMMRR